MLTFVNGLACMQHFFLAHWPLKAHYITYNPFTHTMTAEDSIQAYDRLSSSNLGSSVSPEYTSTCSLRIQGFEPPTLWLVDDSLFLLRFSCLVSHRTQTPLSRVKVLYLCNLSIHPNHHLTWTFLLFILHHLIFYLHGICKQLFSTDHSMQLESLKLRYLYANWSNWAAGHIARSKDSRAVRDGNWHRIPFINTGDDLWRLLQMLK